MSVETTDCLAAFVHCSWFRAHSRAGSAGSVLMIRGSAQAMPDPKRGHKRGRSAEPSGPEPCHYKRCWYRAHSLGTFGGWCCGKCRFREGEGHKPLHGPACEKIPGGPAWAHVAAAPQPSKQRVTSPSPPPRPSPSPPPRPSKQRVTSPSPPPRPSSPQLQPLRASASVEPHDYQVGDLVNFCCFHAQHLDGHQGD